MDYLDSNIETLSLDEDLCVKILAEGLQQGILNLVIGAGVSKSASKAIPDWVELAKFCLIKLKIKYDVEKLQSSNEYLLKRLQDVREESVNKGIQFIDLIKEGLYQGLAYDLKTIRTKLLIAIGSIVMNSSKSKLTTVINYNFDDVIEWYLSFFGYDINIISNPDQIHYLADSYIYHPHGFLPKQNRFQYIATPDVVFSHLDFVRAKWNEPGWNTIQHFLFSSKINLFVGISGDDSHLESLLQYTYHEIIHESRLLGFIVLSTKGKKLKEITEIRKNFQRNGLVLMTIPDHQKLPDLLLKICRKARGIDESGFDK